MKGQEPYAALLDFGLADRRLAEAGAAGLLEPGVVQRARIVARLLADGRTSGQALADSLLVTRAAIHKHVDQLRRAGLSIVSQPGAGYALESLGDLLIPEAFLPLHLARPAILTDSRRRALGCEREAQIPADLCGPGLPYHYYPTVGSTNDVVKELAQAGAPAGSTVVTDFQAEGRGRLGRRWTSRQGRDLTFSVLLRPHTEPRFLPMAVLAAGVAVAETLTLLPGLGGKVGLKWPNDVLLGGKKVAGLLSEASLDMDEIHWVVVGVGLNVNGVCENDIAVREGAPSPGTISEIAGRDLPRPDLLRRLLLQLGERLGQTFAGGQVEIVETFREYDVLRGRTVAIRTDALGEDAAIEGVAEGMGPDGELLLRTSGGDLRAFSFGEATILPTERGPSPPW